jgi:hypothetical protein
MRAWPVAGERCPETAMIVMSIPSCRHCLSASVGPQLRTRIDNVRGERPRTAILASASPDPRRARSAFLHVRCLSSTEPEGWQLRRSSCVEIGANRRPGWLRSSAPPRLGPLIAGCSAHSNETLPDALCRNGKGRLNAEFGYRPGIGRSCLLPAVPIKDALKVFTGDRLVGALAQVAARGWGPHVSMPQSPSHGHPAHPVTNNCRVAHALPRSRAPRRGRALVRLAGRRCGARSPPVTARPAKHLTAVRGGAEPGRGW